MYVLRCVKSGAFNYDMLIRKGQFVNSLGEATKSLKHADIFDRKKDAAWYRSYIKNTKKVYIKRRAGKDNLPAQFEIVPVELSIKELDDRDNYVHFYKKIYELK